MNVFTFVKFTAVLGFAALATACASTQSISDTLEGDKALQEIHDIEKRRNEAAADQSVSKAGVMQYAEADVCAEKDEALREQAWANLMADLAGKPGQYIKMPTAEEHLTATRKLCQAAQLGRAERLQD